MRRIRGRLMRGIVVWTMLLLLVGLVVTWEAVASLIERQQACFLNFPAVACPAGDDPAVARLTFAFFGIPAVWLVGLTLALAARAIRRRRSAAG